MKTNASVYAAIVLAACAAACGEAEPSQTGEPAAMNPSTGTPAAMSPANPVVPAGAAGTASPATPNNPSTPVNTKPVMDPQKPTTPVTPDKTPEQTPGQPTAPMMGAGGARFPDACSERRASWGKPCSTNPDPCNL